MNKVILMGRLTRDPDVRYSTGQEQKAIAKFSLAVDRRMASNDGVNVDFFNCVAFGKKGEFVEKYFRQGMKALVTGRLQNDNYTKQDGTKVYSTGVIVDEMEFCESKSQKNNSSVPDNEGFLNVPEGIQEELPFNITH